MTVETMTVAEATEIIVKTLDDSPIPMLVREINLEGCSLGVKRTAVGQLIKTGKIVRVSSHGELYKYSVPNKVIIGDNGITHLEKMLLNRTDSQFLNTVHGYSLC